MYSTTHICILQQLVEIFLCQPQLLLQCAVRKGLGPHPQVERGDVRYLGEADGAGPSGEDGGQSVTISGREGGVELCGMGRREGERGKAEGEGKRREEGEGRRREREGGGREEEGERRRKRRRGKEKESENKGK